MEKILEEFTNSIKEKLKDIIVSVILFGSKAGEADSGKKSDYNILIILKELNYDALKKLEPGLLKKWIKMGNPAPVIFSEDEFKGSFDVFPVEFLDMFANHKVLFGKNIFDNLKIGDGNLRHEIEYELKSKLLKLRQGWLMFSNNDKMLKSIFAGTISSFLSLFKHVVKLSGEKLPEKKIDSLEILQRLCGIKPEVFRLIYKIKHDEQPIEKYKADGLMKEYLIELAKVVKYVDNFKREDL